MITHRIFCFTSKIVRYGHFPLQKRLEQLIRIRSVLQVILSFDSKLGNVWRSENDGQDWAQVEEVKGKAGDVMEHPFDKERAIILGGEAQTGERKTTNWATKDRGKTWQKFVAELPTSFLQAPIYFHAKNPDYVLYAGRECDPVDFFGPSCVDHV